MRRGFGNEHTRARRETSRENLFVVGVIVLSFVVTLGLSFIFSGKGFLSLAGVFDREKTRTFYAVAVGGYDDMTLARNTAELIKSRGGAGYVTKNSGDEKQNIEIIYAVYPDKSSAEKVLAALDDRSAYTREIKAKEGAYSWCEGDQKTAVKNAMTYFDLAYQTMYDVSNSLNDNVTDVDGAKVKIRVLYKQIEDIKSVFYQNTQKVDKSQITEIKLALITALALVDGIEFGTPVSTCASIRHQLVQLVLCYCSLCNSI